MLKGEMDTMKTIRELREAQGLTQLELALKCGVTPVTIYNWERGKYEPRASQLRKVADAFGTTMDQIQLIETEREPEGKAAA
jgi:transcriptional regulator with XRE-family HTH domain